MDAGKWTLKNKQKKKIHQMMECSFKSFALQFTLAAAAALCELCLKSRSHTHQKMNVIKIL